MRNEAIETIDCDGIRLHVEFLWRTDRYGHVISLTNDQGQMLPVLESIEGAAADAWPASPPFQSLTIQTLTDGRPAALLVGMAGPNHWSASIEATVGQAELVFDIACRHSANPVWLGSKYRLLADTAYMITIRADNARIVYETETVAIEPVSLAEASPTARWRYTLCISPASDL